MGSQGGESRNVNKDSDFFQNIIAVLHVVMKYKHKYLHMKITQIYL